MTQQVLQETLLAWLDAMTALFIDTHVMVDLPTPGATSLSTLFVLEGTPDHLAHLWQLTKQLELLPLVSSWEEVVMQSAPQEYHSLLAVVLAVPAEQWNFVQEMEMSRGEE